MDAHTLGEIEQIKQVKARYFRFMDTKQWQDLRRLLAEDLVWINDPSGEPGSATAVARSADEFVASVSAAFAEAVSVHQGFMPEIELTGERSATGVWAMSDWIDHPTAGRSSRGYGHYHEEYEKGDDGQWRIKRIRLTRLRVDAVPKSAAAT
jgi:hypothetical protein